MIAGLFFGSAILKIPEIFDPTGDQRATSVDITRITNNPAILGLAVAFEFLTALLLLSKRWILGLLAALTLCSVFLVVLTAFMTYGIDLKTCGCFGALEVSGRAHLVLVTGTLLLTASCFLSRVSVGDTTNHAHR